MKMIILAAGEGRRLRPATEHIPKCLVRTGGMTLLDRIIQTAGACGIDDIVIIGGYRHEALSGFPGRKYINSLYASTNMVHTLFCAENEIDGDVVISYSDIIYSPAVLSALLANDRPVATAIDAEWLKLWRLRMDDPLKDAETLQIDDHGNITEIGQKPGDYSEIEGQYMGLTRISGAVTGRVREFYHALDREAVYDGKPFEQMYMTTFIRLIIERLMPVSAAIVRGGWMEVDSLEDIKAYEKAGVERILGGGIL